MWITNCEKLIHVEYVMVHFASKCKCFLEKTELLYYNTVIVNFMSQQMWNTVCPNKNLTIFARKF